MRIDENICLWKGGMKMQQEKSVHKPMLDVEGQVQHLKDKGITF